MDSHLEYELTGNKYAKAGCLHRKMLGVPSPRYVGVGPRDPPLKAKFMDISE